MTTVFLPTVALKAVAANQQAIAPAANATLDPVGLVWRSQGLGGVYATYMIGGTIDAIALCRTNLRAGDRVRVRVGASEAVVNGDGAPVDRSVAAWSGPASLDGAYTYVPLESTIAGPYVRIDITSTGNPAGYVEVQRVMIGKRVECLGVDHGASRGFEDGSVIDDGNGVTTVDRYRVRPSWKFTVTDNTTDSYWRDWEPLLIGLGKTRPVLFIPDDTSLYMQKQATLARVTGSPKGDSTSSDFWKLDINLLAI